MFFNEITFNVITKRSDIALFAFPLVLRSEEFAIIDIREAVIVSNVTEEKIGEVYVWCCRGTKQNYLSFMKKNNFGEHLFEGQLSLW